MVRAARFVRWSGLIALIAALAYVALLLLQFLPFYLEFLQPYRLDPSLDRWGAVVLMAGVLAALVGLCPLLLERQGPGVLVLLGIAAVGAALLFCGAVADGLYGPAYPPAGQVLSMGLLLSALGLLPLGLWALFGCGLPAWAALALLVGSPPFAISLFPLVGPAWALVGYAVFKEGTRRGGADTLPPRPTA